MPARPPREAGPGAGVTTPAAAGPGKAETRRDRCWTLCTVSGNASARFWMKGCIVWGRVGICPQIKGLIYVGYTWDIRGVYVGTAHF